MKTTSPLSLADIELELPLRPVVDDLAGFAGRLSLSAGSKNGYAALAAELFPIDEIASRAIGFSIEISRFLGLAGTSNRNQVVTFLDMLMGLSLLNAASVLTVALVAPRTPVQAAIRRRVLADIIAVSGNEPELAATARQAFAHVGEVGSGDIEVVLEAAVVPPLGEARDARPTMLGLEQGLSVAEFVKALAAPSFLVERAALQLNDADQFEENIAHEDHDAERLDWIQRAIAGAHLLAAADLARACLVNAFGHEQGTSRAAIAEQVARIDDPRLRDVVLLAGQMAKRLQQLRSMQLQATGNARAF